MMLTIFLLVTFRVKHGSQTQYMKAEGAGLLCWMDFLGYFTIITWMSFFFIDLFYMRQTSPFQVLGSTIYKYIRTRKMDLILLMQFIESKLQVLRRSLFAKTVEVYTVNQQQDIIVYRNLLEIKKKEKKKRPISQDPSYFLVG